MSNGEQRAEAIRLLKSAADKAKRSGRVPFPPGFVIAAEGEKQAPPLARLVQGGRGGEVRLKLYMCITMMATGKPYDLRTPPSPNGWARMLALDPKKGPRRVSSNLKWLADNNFIRLEPQWGRPSAITLLSAAGSGEEYSQPRDGGRYVGVPLGFWIHGWILSLSPTATAVLFALIEALGGHSEARYIPTARRQRYGLSADTWTKARKELEIRSLLVVKREPQGTFYDFTRLRNAYQLDLERLDAPPNWT
ncbi:hypothetical protein [Streptomyces albidoflavus]|uniref:hypothetical protein n=1 Tax=Streptomyces albidoflavus TaxID=1886 RepID=UPI00101EE4C9|nr:hypothetical protein [Streptomyces albidoflavus]RZD83260.1 hypothetical protein C0Q61_08085 [Streptomyces albidoflavus]